MMVQIRVYGIMLLTLVLTALFGKSAPRIYELFESHSEPELLIAFFSISILCILSFIIHHQSKRTFFPSFVVAIFFGIAARPFLSHIINDQGTVIVLVGVGATLILFSGGLETPFDHFKKLIAPICSLSFLGLFITSILASLGSVQLGNLFGIHVSLSTALLLGAILASTDPAAIIPILRSLRFRRQAAKNIIISESALTDVTGTLLTLAFLTLLVGGIGADSVLQGYRQLISPAIGWVLLFEVTFGIIFGILGYLLLRFLNKFTKECGGESAVDAAYFLFVPIIIFTFASSFGGSGYLAAFIAGLLFVMARHLHDTEHYFNHTIEGFLKPIIFILLGAMVNISTLVSYAGIGVALALIFIFIIRPIAVFVSLGLFTLRPGSAEALSWRDLLFMSWIRETGAIPAVLLVTVASAGLGGVDGLIPIGMWVILSTLIIQPPLTHLVARWTNVGDKIQDEEALALGKGKEPFIVLGSRGHSFARRLPYVADWAGRHNIFHVSLLLCLESRYTEETDKEMRSEAEKTFAAINKERRKHSLEEIQFDYVGRKGFLQENIDTLAKQQANVSAIFVGRKVLDFGLERIKQMQVPLFFID